MTNYKLRDWEVGEAIFRGVLSANKCRDLEDVIFRKLKDSMPKGTVVTYVEVTVGYDVARQIGEPVYDAEMYQWKVNLHDFSKESEKP